MNDPWKYPAFSAAAVLGYLLSLGLTQQFSSYTGLSEFGSRLSVIALTGLFAGFMVDEVIPAYIEKVSSRGSGGTGDMDIGDGDLDFDS